MSEAGSCAGLDFFFHMFFLTKYSKSLEEESFRRRSADFLWMLLFGAGVLLAVAPLVHLQFLGSSLTFMMVYVWGRRHPYVQLSMMGLFNFTAPYLPWVLLAFSVMLGNSPLVDLLGMMAGATGRGGKGWPCVFFWCRTPFPPLAPVRAGSGCWGELLGWAGEACAGVTRGRLEWAPAWLTLAGGG